MSSRRAIEKMLTLFKADKESLLTMIRNHQINTVIDLRRVERALAEVGTPDVSEAMTAAWAHYVNSNSLLTELRALTRNYPFNSDCLDEGKRRVYADPTSNRSWNLCWLTLKKIQDDALIPYYATYQAALPLMWGGLQPSAEGVLQLANAFDVEWTAALGEMLRHWEEDPCW